MRLMLAKDDVEERELRSIRIGDLWVLLTRVEGTLFALDDQCNHAGCLLSGGWLEGSEVVCPCHGRRYDVRSGRNTTVPRLGGDQERYPLDLVGGEVLVELPERPRR